MPLKSTEAREADRRVRLPRVFRFVERLALRLETPIRRVVGSQRLDPLPHAGTISVFLLIVVIVTGVYLTLFFEFGFEDSYRAVSEMEGHPIQRTIRGIHRFASAALVVTTVVHAWRIFVMQRFTGPRRWRWVTGSLALVTVWVSGVTGYWLIWDRRAQALTEATAELVEPIWPSLGVGVAVPSGSGWPWLLAIWTIHLLLSAVVGWALWRHLRRTRHRWLPPRRWMWAMTGALATAAVAFPAGMLPPADPAVAPGALPLDPFVMFLLPPLLSPWRWLVVVAGASLGVALSTLPWMLKVGTPVARVIEESCTGCELCVIDCPYQALEMSGDEQKAVAVVIEDRCVGCGICLGSCAFDAITGLGDDPLATVEVDGPVALVCSRQERAGDAPQDVATIVAQCTGALSPRTVGALLDRGATSVQVIGCPPGDCAYGIGNLITSERIGGLRRPLLPRRWSGSVRQDWVSPVELRRALDQPGMHAAADLDSRPKGGWKALVPAGIVVLASVLAIRFATDATFGSPADGGWVRLVIDHAPGERLEGIDLVPAGRASIAVDTASGRLATVALDADTGMRDVVDIPLDPGEVDLVVALIDETGSSELYRAAVTIEPGRRLLVEVVDAGPEPGIERGRELFEGAGLGGNLGCDICHSVRPGEVTVGPSLSGIGVVAGSRVPGMSAEEYLRSSILDPDAHVVDGFRSGQMPAIYGDRLDVDDIDALVAYLMSLGEPG